MDEQGRITTWPDGYLEGEWTLVIDDDGEAIRLDGHFGYSYDYTQDLNDDDALIFAIDGAYPMCGPPSWGSSWYLERKVKG